MKVKQISVFLENKTGRLAAVTDALASNGVNIRALSIADTSDFGILRLIVDQPDKAYDILKAQKFTVSVTDVIGVEIPDQPGGLARVLLELKEAEINIEYLYAFLGRGQGGAIVVFRVEKIESAIAKLGNSGLNILKGEDIYKM
jgi:hypothetical protein